jgi:hypothetical protein
MNGEVIHSLNTKYTAEFNGYGEEIKAWLDLTFP